MENDIARFELAQIAPTVDDPLLRFLKANIGKPVSLSFAKVVRLDALRLQTILVAQDQWQRDHVSFDVCDISNACSEKLTLLGVKPGQFRMDAQV